MRVTAQLMLGRQPGLDTKGLLKDLRALDPYQIPDIDALLKKHGGEIKRGGRTIMTSTGQFHKEERLYEWRKHLHDAQAMKIDELTILFRRGADSPSCLY